MPCRRSARLGSTEPDGKPRGPHAAGLEPAIDFSCFQRRPAAGRRVLVGLTERRPSCAVVLRFDCDIEGVGVDPTNPPLVWEAWTGDGWSGVRGRARRHRRPEPDRRRRPARPAPGTRPRWSATARRLAACRVRRAARAASRLQRVPGDHGPSRRSRSAAPSRRSNAEHGPRRGARRLRGRPRPAVPARRAARSCPAAEPRGARGRRRARAGRSGRRSTSFADSGPSDTALRARPVAGEVALRPGGPRAGRHAAPVRRRPAEGRGAADARVPHRRRAARQRLAAGADRAAKSSIPYVARVDEPAAAQRRRRRRGRRERQGARPAPAAHPRPGGHRRGLRAARPRGGARGGPGALRAGRRTRRTPGGARAGGAGAAADDGRVAVRAAGPAAETARTRSRAASTSAA